MSQLEYMIMGQSYMLTCPEGTEEKMSNAVAHVDQTMCRIRDAGKLKQRDRIAVLAALNLCFELETGKNQLAQAVQTFEHLEMQALEANRQIRELEDALYETTAQLEAVQAQLASHLHSLAAVQVEQLANAFDLHHEEIPENNLSLQPLPQCAPNGASQQATKVSNFAQESDQAVAKYPATLSEVNTASAPAQVAQTAHTAHPNDKDPSYQNSLYTAQQDRAVSMLNRLDGVLQNQANSNPMKDSSGYNN